VHATVCSQTDSLCADFEKRLREIAPGAAAAAPATATHRGGAHTIPGTAIAACAVLQAQSGSLLLAATGALRHHPPSEPHKPSDAPIYSPIRRAGDNKAGVLGRDAEEMLRAHLKRKHAAAILSLKEEFTRKRKKGKLPKDATTALKTWWQGNLVWPYPSVRGVSSRLSVVDLTLRRAQDEEKRTLGDETGLNPTQINNCAWVESVGSVSESLTPTNEPDLDSQGSSTSASATGTR